MHQNPRQRSLDRDYVSILADKFDKHISRPVLIVTGRIPERMPVLSSYHVQYVPNWLMRYAYDQILLGDRNKFPHCCFGVSEMLQNFTTQYSIGPIDRL